MIIHSIYHCIIWHCVWPKLPFNSQRLFIYGWIFFQTFSNLHLLCHCFACTKYDQSYNHFIFEYGRNNIDDYYPIIEFIFDPDQIATDPNAFNLVAVLANSTHLTVRLQARNLSLKNCVPCTLNLRHLLCWLRLQPCQHIAHSAGFRRGCQGETKRL